MESKVIRFVTAVVLVSWLPQPASADPRPFCYTARLAIDEHPDAVPAAKADGAKPAAGSAADTGLIETHAAVFCSPLIVGKAILQKRLRELASLKHVPDPAATILGGLAAGRLPGEPGNVMVVSYCGCDQKDSCAILSAVIDAYRQFLVGTPPPLAKTNEALSKRIAAIEAECKNRAKPPAGDGGSAHDTTQGARVAELEKSRASQEVENLRLAAEIAVRQAGASATAKQLTELRERLDAGLKKVEQTSTQLLAERAKAADGELNVLREKMYGPELDCLKALQKICVSQLQQQDGLRISVIRSLAAGTPPTAAAKQPVRKTTPLQGLVAGLLGSAPKPSDEDVIDRSWPFQAKARLVMIKSPATNPRDAGAAATAHSPFLTLEVLFSSRRVVKQTMQKHDLQRLSSLKELHDPVEYVLEGLDERSTPSRAADAAVGILEVSYHGANAADCKPILSAVVDEFRSFWTSHFKSSTGDVVATMVQATIDTNKKCADLIAPALNESEKRIRNAQQRSGIAAEAAVFNRAKQRLAKEMAIQRTIDDASSAISPPTGAKHDQLLIDQRLFNDLNRKLAETSRELRKAAKTAAMDGVQEKLIRSLIEQENEMYTVESQQLSQITSIAEPPEITVEVLSPPQ